MGAATFADKLRESLPVTLGDVTVSFGVTDADAERRGRNRVVAAEGQRPSGRRDEDASPFAVTAPR